MSIYNANWPAGTAYNNLINLGQCYNTKRYAPMQKNVFDPIPDLYQTEKITAPSVIVYCETDLHTDPIDIETLEEEINTVGMIKVYGYNTIDFVWGQNAWKDVYLRILPYLRNCTQVTPILSNA